MCLLLKLKKNQISLNRIVCLIFIFNSILYCSCQDKSLIIQQRIEFVSEQLEGEEIDLSFLTDQLNYFYDHPLNLNNANEEELQELSLLNEFQIKNLLLHLEINGKLITIYELQSLELWDLQLIQMLLPFVRVDDKLDQVHVRLKEALKYGDLESLIRFQSVLQDINGYSDFSDSFNNSTNSYYLGNKHHYYTRMKYSYRTNFSMGITGDKDAGEQFFKGAQKNGFDFYSMHAFFKGGKYLKSLAIGDYQIQVGQGLNLWTGYAFGKSADATNVKKTASSIKPYTSVDENRFLRGLAFEVGFRKLSLVGFASNKKIDATIVTDSVEIESDIVSSIQQTGFHRTSAEVARKNSLTEKLIGSNLKFKTRSFQCGIAIVHHGYDQFYNKEILPYNQFDFRGQSRTNLSSDYSFVMKNLLFFGEVVSKSDFTSVTQIHGLLVSLHSKATLSFVYRNYKREFHSFYSSGFAEGSATKNEKGLYISSKIKFLNSLHLNCYLDVFSFPWLKYLVDKPSSGYDLLTQLTYKPTKSLEVYGRYRERLTQRNSPAFDGSVGETEDVIQRNFRLNLTYVVSESISLKSRVEVLSYTRKSSKPEAGTLIYQDIQFKPKMFPFDISLRYVLFDTDSYDSRIYSYESNALNVFSIPAFYYKGSRAYVLIRYTFCKNIDFWLKYGSSLYVQRKTIGTGLEEIEGNSKSDLTFQLRVKL
jgi:hypothetical protein